VILEIDAGNSRVKWRVVGRTAISDCVAVSVGSIEEMLEAPVLSEVRRVRISSVRSVAANKVIAEAILRFLGVVPEFAQSMEYCAGVKNAYSQPERLGVDRWMAILAGRTHVCEQSYLILDAGSAITIDFVDASGVHLGGYITPGLHLQLESLRLATAMEINSDFFWGDLTPGRDTEHAIRNGILGMVCHWVAAEALGRNAMSDRVLVTGGDGLLLAGKLRSLGIETEYLPNLVLDGLRVALP